MTDCEKYATCWGICQIPSWGSEENVWIRLVWWVSNPLDRSSDLAEPYFELLTSGHNFSSNCIISQQVWESVCGWTTKIGQCSKFAPEVSCANFKIIPGKKVWYIKNVTPRKVQNGHAQCNDWSPIIKNVTDVFMENFRNCYLQHLLC